MNCQRRILAVKWPDIVTNESISAITGLDDDIRDIARRRTLGLFGHVARLDCNVPATSALKETADHRTRHGSDHGDALVLPDSTKSAKTLNYRLSIALTLTHDRSGLTAVATATWLHVQ